jgi:hypothetical protein
MPGFPPNAERRDRSGPDLPLDALGVIGPVDASEVERELRALHRRPANAERTGTGGAETSETPGSRCRILARDPYWLHVFWELDEAQVLQVARGLEVPFEDLRWILRVHSLPPQALPAGGSQPPGFFDVEIAGDEASTYVHVGLPDRDYRVDIGLLTDRGLFSPLASSNRVRTPRDGVAAESGTADLYEESGGSPAARIERPDPPSFQRDISASQRPSRREAPIDGEGAAPTDAGRSEGNTRRSHRSEPHALGPVTAAGSSPGAAAGAAPAIGASLATPAPGSVPGGSPAAGFSPGALPAAPEGAAAWVSSPGAARPTSPGAAVTSPHGRPAVQAPQPSAERGFWLSVQTELVVSGATEPDARVTIQGIPIPLRADGTFTVRFELPDGEQVVPVIAVSRDGTFEREITPRVVRETRRVERHPSAGTDPAGSEEAEAPTDVDDAGPATNGSRRGGRRRRGGRSGREAEGRS